MKQLNKVKMNSRIHYFNLLQDEELLLYLMNQDTCQVFKVFIVLM